MTALGRAWARPKEFLPQLAECPMPRHASSTPSAPEEVPQNIYEFLKWLIIYATANGEEHQRFRALMLTGWALTCVIILVIGISVAIAHAGMPLMVTYSIGAGGTALFALATAIMSRLRRPKKALRMSPQRQRPHPHASADTATVTGGSTQAPGPNNASPST